MILDRLDNADTYAAVDGLADAFAFLRRGGFEELTTGRHEVGGEQVGGERMYVMVNRYTTKAPSELPYEAHRAWLDVHYIVSGRETLYWEDIAAMPEGGGYQAEGDAELFRHDGGLPVVLEPGMFVVLYPQDAHKPGCVAGPAVPTVKVVVKLRL